MPSRENTATSEVIAGAGNNTRPDFHHPPEYGKRTISRGRFETKQQQNPFTHVDEEDLDYAIDTSALRVALPEFSDGRSSEEDEEDDLSVEVGRGGVRKGDFKFDESRDSIMSFDDSRLSGSPGGLKTGGREAAAATGSRHPLRSVSNRTVQRNSDTLRRDAQIRRASLVSQKENVNPKGGARTKNTAPTTASQPRQQRRTLSDMHARVSETYDGSYLSDERPPIGHATSKSTRFGQPQQKITMAVKNAAVGRQADKSNVWAYPSNHESFLLPDIDNLSELVSGIYQDGELANGHAKRPRTTRFTSPPAVEISQPSPESHANFDAIPIPEDEKAIFASLRLLQRKVSSLEKDNAEVEAQLEQLRRENTMLRADQLRRREPGAGTQEYEGGEDGFARGGAATLAVEKNRLEAANQALRNRLETGNKKLSGQESSAQKAAEERISVINQRGAVYLSREELKTDNEALRLENERLKERLVKMIAPSESKGLGAKHRTHATEHQKEPARPKSKKTCEQTPQNNDDRYEALFSLGPSTAYSPKQKELPERKTLQAADKKLPNTGRQRARRNNEIDGEGDATEFSVLQPRNVTKDLTHLTFIDSREIAQLRRTLEEERIARKQGRLYEYLDRTRSIGLTKHSLKDVTRMSSKAVAAEMTQRDVTATDKTGGFTNRNDDFTRASSCRGSRPDDVTDGDNDDNIAMVAEMTSAFILPDITIYGAAQSRGTGPALENVQLSDSAQRGLDDAVRHERNNCTVCDKDANINIPKPTPVSEREHPVECTRTKQGHKEDEAHEHTLRPSQPPADALAKVVKMLEDELAHLKMRLAVCQSRYSRHDAAVGRRTRVKLGDQMKGLMTEIENRSEVVYALYDVLEGQKEECGSTQADKKCALSGVVDDEEEEGDLPWEGFESTQDGVTGRSLVRR